MNKTNEKKPTAGKECHNDKCGTENKHKTTTTNMNKK